MSNTLISTTASAQVLINCSAGGVNIPNNDGITVQVDFTDPNNITCAPVATGFVAIAHPNNSATFAINPNNINTGFYAVQSDNGVTSGVATTAFNFPGQTPVAVQPALNTLSGVANVQEIRFQNPINNATMTATFMVGNFQVVFVANNITATAAGAPGNLDAAGIIQVTITDLTPAAPAGPTVQQTQAVIANFMHNRANHILNNQPDLISFVDGSNTQGGGIAGSLALNVNSGSQALAFSTSRSKILSGIQEANAKALNGIYDQSDTSQASENVTLLSRLYPSEHALGFATNLTKAHDAANQALEVHQSSDPIIHEDNAVLETSSRAGSWDVWTEIYGANSNAGSSDSFFWVGYVGAHYFVDDHTLFGVLGQIDWAEETNAAVNSNADGLGWAIGPYLAGQLPGQNLFYQLRASVGTSDNDVSPIGTYTDSFDTVRWLASGKISGSFEHDEYTISPSLSVSYYEEAQEAYTDTLNNTIPEQTISLGEIRFGPTVSRSITIDDGATLTPHVGVSGIFNFGINNIAATQGFALGEDDFRARFNFGLSRSGTDGVVFSLDAYYDGAGVSDYEAFGGSARVSIPLN